MDGASPQPKELQTRTRVLYHLPPAMEALDGSRLRAPIVVATGGQAGAAQQVLKAGIAAQRVIDWIYLESNGEVGTFRVTPLQQGYSLVFLV